MKAFNWPEIALARHGRRRDRRGRRRGGRRRPLRRRSRGDRRAARRGSVARPRQSARGGLRGPAPLRRPRDPEQGRPDVERSSAAASSARSARPLPRAVKVVRDRRTAGSTPPVLLGLGAAAEDDLASRPSHHDARGRARPRRFRQLHRRAAGRSTRRSTWSTAWRRRAEAHDILRMKGFVDDRRQADAPARAGRRRALPASVRPRLARGRGARGRLVVIGEKGLDRDAIDARSSRRLSPCTSSPPSLRRSTRPTSPSISASRRPTSSCCPSPTAIFRRLPPPGSSEADCCRRMRLASLKRLRHPMSVDLYVESVVAARARRHRALPGRARLLALRPGAHRRRRARARHPVRGPAGRRPRRSAARRGLDPAAATAGDRSTASSARAALTICGRRCAMPARCCGRDLAWTPPVAGRPGLRARRRARAGPARSALIVFYRANLMAADTAPITALMEALDRQGLAPLAVAVTASRTRWPGRELKALIATHSPSIILNTTAFSATARGRHDGARRRRCAGAAGRAVGQRARGLGRVSTRGLSPADLAMNVVLPELDGRLLDARHLLQGGDADRSAPGIRRRAPRARSRSHRLRGAARGGLGAARRARRAHERRLALVLSDYPARGGRTGYAVGLDTPASAAGILTLLRPKATTPAGRDWRARRHRAPAGAAMPSSTSTIPLRWLRCRLSLQRAADRGLGRPRPMPSACPCLRCGKVLVLLQPDRGSARRSQVGLPRHRPARRAMPMSPSIPGCARSRHRRADPSRHARHAGMAARQGAGAVGRLLARGRCSARCR